MNLDKALETIEQGFNAPETIIRRVPVKADDLAQYGLRRKGKEEIHWVWMVSIGERGAASPTAFFLERKLVKAMKKALEWRGVKPATRVRKQSGATQPQAGA